MSHASFIRMDWRSPRFRLVAAALALAMLLGWFLWWRSPEVQAPRTFAALQQAFADGSAGGVLDQVHGDYDFTRHWPTVPWNEMGGGEPRQSVVRAMTLMFLSHRENRLQLTVDIQSVAPGPDGRTTVTATLQLSSRQGDVPFRLGPIHRHRFVLVSTGFTGHLAIIDHDPIGFER